MVGTLAEYIEIAMGIVSLCKRAACYVRAQSPA
jgi:hypothetical protein